MKCYIVKQNLLILLFSLLAVLCGCAGNAASAEEYYLIGMAYFDLGRYEDAERWLLRASRADRTMIASQYNLGRVAFARQNYPEAAELFEGILKLDPDNVIALRAAAYTRIRTGEIDIAETHYNKLLELVPESVDDGYNHALVLYAMGFFERAEETLRRYPFALETSSEMQLLLARSQRAQNKVEAIDSYATWLNENTDPAIQFEYAQVLEEQELFARAIEEYRKLLTEEGEAPAAEPKQSDVHFSIARVLLVADAGSREGVDELETAISKGFDDIEKIEQLLNDTRISAANLGLIRVIYEGLMGEEEGEE